MSAVTPDTTVRMNIRQLVGLAVFIACNTTVITLWFDRRMSAVEHAGERQADRISIVERAHDTLTNEVSEQNDKLSTKVDRLTDAINALAVNVAKLGAKEP